MKRSLSMVSAGLLTIMVALPALAQQATTAPPPGYMYHRHMWHGGFFGPLLMVLVIFALVALFMRFGFWRGHHGYRSYRAGGGALDILEERFARGEIDKAEFEDKRKLLIR